MGPTTATLDWKTQLQPHYTQPILSVQAKKLQSLWAGYGAVNALKVQFDGAPSVQLIAKSVHPQRSSGISHERKVASYRCEAEFYKQHAPALIKASGLGVPRPLVVESTAHGWEFVLTDLSMDFPESSGCLDDSQVNCKHNCSRGRRGLTASRGGHGAHDTGSSVVRIWGSAYNGTHSALDPIAETPSTHITAAFILHTNSIWSHAPSQCRVSRGLAVPDAATVAILPSRRSARLWTGWLPTTPISGSSPQHLQACKSRGRTGELASRG